MENLFDDIEFDVECPSCGEEILFKVGDVGNSVICQNCNESVLLEDDGTFSSGVEEVNKSLKELDDILGNFGK